MASGTTLINVQQSLHHETKRLLQMALQSHLALLVHFSAVPQELGNWPETYIIPGREKIFCCGVQVQDRPTRELQQKKR